MNKIQTNNFFAVCVTSNHVVYLNFLALLSPHLFYYVTSNISHNLPNSQTITTSAMVALYITSRRVVSCSYL